jgi:hypothetical protein
MGANFDQFRRLFVEERMSVFSIYECFERKVTRFQLKEWGKQLLKEAPNFRIEPRAN